jgi:hypothetical protein
VFYHPAEERVTKEFVYLWPEEQGARSIAIEEEFEILHDGELEPVAQPASGLAAMRYSYRDLAMHFYPPMKPVFVLQYRHQSAPTWYEIYQGIEGEKSEVPWSHEPIHTQVS